MNLFRRFFFNGKKQLIL